MAKKKVEIFDRGSVTNLYFEGYASRSSAIRRSAKEVLGKVPGIIHVSWKEGGRSHAYWEAINAPGWNIRDGFVIDPHGDGVRNFIVTEGRLFHEAVELGGFAEFSLVQDALVSLNQAIESKNKEDILAQVSQVVSLAICNCEKKGVSNRRTILLKLLQGVLKGLEASGAWSREELPEYAKLLG